MTFTRKIAMTLEEERKVDTLMKKVGIMGGTFNPIHHGHLFLAENAYEQFGLDEVLFMPSKNPPHKVIAGNVTDQQRTDMITLAIQDNPHFLLSTIELEREGWTFTADTLSIMTKENPEVEYYFIVGADSLFMMQQWKDPQIVFDLSTIVVANRDNTDLLKLNEHAEYLKNLFQAKILILDMPTIQISSANIRERVTQEKTVRYYLPDAVIEYVKNNQLYRNTEE